jgi:folate-dependent tRNA-U54 methylase TrmFO/GidA
MNVNFGLFPPIEKLRVKDGKRLKHAEQAVERKRSYCLRAQRDFKAWLANAQMQAAE